MDYDYDLVCIGSGPAGEKGAAQAAWFGKRVAVVELGRPGGTCAHHGTLPSKSLRESALYLSGLKSRAIAGVLGDPVRPLPVERLMAHAAAVSAAEDARVRANLARHRIELVIGRGALVDPHTVEVTADDGGVRRLTAEVILLATGSRPWKPAHIPFDGTEVYCANDILSLDFIPESLVVIGGGVIGSEYASIFAALGVEVTLLEGRDRLMGFLDREIADHLTEAFAEVGVDVRLSATVQGVRVAGDDRVETTLEGGEVLVSNKLLYAAGRVGNTEGLGLERVGVTADRRGQIAVDACYRTACPSVYAAGDLIGFPALASTSMDQGRLAMCYAFGFDYKQSMTHLLPYGLYTVPELSMVGAREEDLRARGEDYEVGRAWFKENARGQISGTRTGLLKLLFRASDKTVLGVHVVGEHAAELVHVGMTVMQLGGTLDTFIDAVYNFPTLSEAYKYAAYDGLGRLAARAR
jgi:NAD(P) transhydrogenase